MARCTQEYEGANPYVYCDEYVSLPCSTVYTRITVTRPTELQHPLENSYPVILAVMDYQTYLCYAEMHALEKRDLVVQSQETARELMLATIVS